MKSESDPAFLSRLKVAADRVGGPDALARAAGIKRRTLGNYLAGRNEPRRIGLADIARAARVTVEWLAAGRGPMESEDDPAADINLTIARAFKRGVERQRAGEDRRPEFVYVPRYEVTVSAGPGAIVGDENVRDYLAFRQDFVRRELGVDPKDVFSFDAVGDSMKPTIENGDTLTFVRFKDAAPAEGIFAIGIGEALLVKRLQPIINGLMILSDNTAYKTETLGLAEARDVRILGQLKVISRVV